MSNSFGKDISEAFQILGQHERTLVSQLAKEVIERRAALDEPFGDEALDLVEKHYMVLARLCHLRSLLSTYLPDGSFGELGKNEFRCFKCRCTIQATDNACPQCGWTWG